MASGNIFRNLAWNPTYARILPKNEKFGLNSKSAMLKTASIKEGKAPIKEINPLSVSENSSGKKCLVLDLR